MEASLSSPRNGESSPENQFGEDDMSPSHSTEPSESHRVPLMTEEEKREAEEAVKHLEAETRRFESEKIKSLSMHEELKVTQEEIVSRETRWSSIKSKLGLTFLDDAKAKMKEVAKKNQSFGLGLGRTMSHEKALPFAVGTGLHLERTNSGAALSANLTKALMEDLDRIQAECSTKQVLNDPGTKLLLFASDGLYIMSPGAMGMGVAVKVTDSFGDAVASCALGSGQVSVVTSTGYLPETGDIWEATR